MDIQRINNLEIRIFPDADSLSLAAADILVSESRVSIEARGIFTVSLSGGRTSQKLYELLGSDFKDSIDWEKVHIFWGDERSGRNDKESCFQLAYHKWLSNIVKDNPSFEDNIHRMKIELGLVEGVADYEKELEKWAPQGFDLALNGAGADGHRNAVMPERQDVNWENGIWNLPKSVRVYGYSIPKEISSCTEKMTLTPWFLNKSRVNILMLSGEEKKELLRRITHGQGKYTNRLLPAITFNDVPTIVLVDRAASAGILN
jgi:6-phosphogluconolactonase